MTTRDAEPSTLPSRPVMQERTITVDLDGELADRLSWIAWSEKTSEEGLLTRIIESEWMVMKFRVTGLIAQAACGTAAVLSMFAYAYWILSSQVPSSFNLPMARIDAVYFTLGTFTTTGVPAGSARSRREPNCWSVARSCSGGHS